MKLNPKKCVFGVKAGKFLGFLVSKRGIDSNPEKIQAIITLPEPSVKDIQSLTGRTASLTRFISKSVDKALPFFTLLRGNRKFEWGEEQSKAFLAVKEQLKSLPTITRPKIGDILQLYISVSSRTVAAVLLVEQEKRQRPIYFITHILNGLESLQARTAIKAQALADFIQEASYEEEEAEQEQSWLLEVDGFAAVSGFGTGIVMTSPEENVYQYTIKFGFSASNNEVEYEAAIAGLRMCLAAGAKNVLLKTDLQLVSGQLRGEFEVTEANMIKYVEKTKELIAQLSHFEVQAIPRAENMKADTLSKLASSDSFNIEETVTIDIQKEKRITEHVVTVNSINQQGEWFSELVAYKLTGALPNNPSFAKKLR
ncbi:uncharacterized protein LOC104894800 [Beta vulgaris subsp. vulgaris]|uniref:uncharacterized protein LOC104894800 n=1 Tax=Beta vulgaris subsp. vulgaris TaxID=3555 RepID=UPI00053FF535|nr:uncharacterized protein LOC104894800 [Beta vulgaris subsp. vulgaris]